MGGGGGDGEGERGCLEDFGLALREADGEPSGFDAGSGLFVSLEEASPESLSVAADFGLKAESAEEEEGGSGEGERWRLSVERVDLPFCAGEGWPSSGSESVELFSPPTVDIGRVEEGGWTASEEEREEGRGESGPIRKVQTILWPFPLYFLISNAFETASVLRYNCSVARSVAPIRSAFPIIPGLCRPHPTAA